VHGKVKRDYYKDIGRDTVPKNLDDYRIRSNEIRQLGGLGPRYNRKNQSLSPDPPDYPHLTALYERYP